jgi:hypothetical protein
MKNCPECKGVVKLKNVFTFKEIKCKNCGAPLQTDFIYRLAFISSVSVLIVWYIYVNELNKWSDSKIVWGGLLLILAPFIIMNQRTILKLGNQKSVQSTSINITFVITCLILAAYVFISHT